MQTFSSSTKVLTSFADSAQIRELTRVFDDRLSGLTRLEKYQLVAAIVEVMTNIADDEENPIEGLANPTDITKVNVNHFRCSPDDNALKAIGILKGEHPANLAAILAPIAEYAREDDRLSR
jgi:hypothetical protein